MTFMQEPLHQLMVKGSVWSVCSQNGAKWRLSHGDLHPHHTHLLCPAPRCWHSPHPQSQGRQCAGPEKCLRVAAWRQAGVCAGFCWGQLWRWWCRKFHGCCEQQFRAWWPGPERERHVRRAALQRHPLLLCVEQNHCRFTGQFLRLQSEQYVVLHP